MISYEIIDTHQRLLSYKMTIRVILNLYTQSQGPLLHSQM